jgi:hypothetical protein
LAHFEDHPFIDPERYLVRLTPSDPDVETLVGRIDSNEIDLQPDFQRGEVWSLAKKQRLIDSILRDWHVPPVHLIVDQESHRLSVLDGQQRLAAIRDFKKGHFPIDGAVPPIHTELESLDGKTFDELPREWKARFNQFTIRVFRISDYQASEPAELFFRLNQPTALTSAEKRNAFFGSTREQVRELVQLMDNLSLAKGFWGFSSARMAYDDIVARACLTLENGSLRKKVTAGALADRYRTGTPFSERVASELQRTLEILGIANRSIDENLGFNKATAQSCLIFAFQLVRQIRSRDDTAEHLAKFLRGFAHLEKFSWLGGDANSAIIMDAFSEHATAALLQVYTDRSTSRVADTSSVVLRDFVIWCMFFAYARGNEELLVLREVRSVREVKSRIESIRKPNEVEALANELDWDLAK